PGAARALGARAGATRGAGADHCGCARRSSLPLHRLHQISRGGARCDSRRFKPLSHCCQVSGLEGTRAMISHARFRMIAVIAALASSLCAAYAASETASHALASPESFAGISDTDKRSAAIFTELGKVLTHPRCTNCH